MLDEYIKFLNQIWKSAVTCISATFFPSLTIFAENRGIFFGDFFFHKSVLGSPDSNLSKF